MEKLNGRLITVIGGGGFVGRYVVQHLLALGARVRIAQRDPRKATYLRPLGGLGQTQFVRCDVREADSVLRAVQGSDAVINLAGSFAEMQAVQADGASHVAQAVRRHNVRIFVHLSAIGADPAASSVYGRSKGDGEAAVRAACPHAVLLRPSIIFGQEDQFINRFAAMIRMWPIVPVIEGKSRFQPVYVGDVADAIVAALAPTAAGQTYELGGPEIFSMEELLHWIADATGYDRKFVHVPGGLIAALPGAPISKDQLKMLKTDNIVSASAEGLSALGVTPTALAAVADDWLAKYRQSGRFSVKRFA